MVGLFNLSGEPVEATLADGLAAGIYTEFRSGAPVTVEGGATVTLPAWGFRLLSDSGRSSSDMVRD